MLPFWISIHLICCPQEDLFNFNGNIFSSLLCFRPSLYDIESAESGLNQQIFRALQHSCRPGLRFYAYHGTCADSNHWSFYHPSLVYVLLLMHCLRRLFNERPASCILFLLMPNQTGQNKKDVYRLYYTKL